MSLYYQNSYGTPQYDESSDISWVVGNQQQQQQQNQLLMQSQYSQVLAANELKSKNELLKIEVLNLKMEIDRLKENKTKVDVAVQTGYSRASPVNDYFEKKNEAYKRLLIEIDRVIDIYNLCIPKDSSPLEKRRVKSKLTPAAQEVLQSQGFSHKEISVEAIRKTKNAMSKKISNKKYDSKRAKKIPANNNDFNNVHEIETSTFEEEIETDSGSSVDETSTIEKEMDDEFDFGDEEIIDEFNPKNPYLPEAVKRGMICAFAYCHKKGKRQIFYGEIVDDPIWKSKKHYATVEWLNEKLKPDHRYERKVEPLRDMIYMDVIINKGKIVNIHEIERRYDIYSNQWFKSCK